MNKPSRPDSNLITKLNAKDAKKLYPLQIKNYLALVSILFFAHFWSTKTCPTCINFSDQDSRPFFEQYKIPAEQDDTHEKSSNNAFEITSDSTGDSSEEYYEQEKQ